MTKQQEIVLKGASTHNLKHVDVSIPHGVMAVFTGVSGSGKSSLAFDTIFAEGQRRYVESLSAYARQFLGQMNKPPVEFIEGLSPAVSIDQKSTNRNPRSTVGTITEIYDYLRLLWARIGKQHCPICGEMVVAQTKAQICDQLLSLPSGTRLQILAPVVRDRKGEYAKEIDNYRKLGFSRIIIDGKMHRLSEEINLAKTMRHNIEIVVDRLVIDNEARERLSSSVETALDVADGYVYADLTDDGVIRKFSSKRSCPNNHQLELNDIEPRTFSFNAPFGACPECTGLGFKHEIDPELIIPDPDLTIMEGAIHPWRNSVKGNNTYYFEILESLQHEYDFDFHTPFKDILPEVQKVILYGVEDRVEVQFTNRWGRTRSYSAEFEGVINQILRRYNQTESDNAKRYYEQYLRDIPCPVCGGEKLKPEVLSVKVGGLSISKFTDLSIMEASEWITNLWQNEVKMNDLVISEPIFKEISSRLQFLNNVGLNYLTLSRAAGTLSGGEAQRIRLATQIGSGLVGVLYVLDEPSIGLHQRDNARLISALENLRNIGNTLIVVEHDEDTIKHSDWVVDIGPNAGIHGGDVVYQGPIADFKKAKSLTSDYIYGRKTIPVPAKRRKVIKSNSLKVIGAVQNNLQNINVNFPLGVFTCVTGVSGSGKSSLVNGILYHALAAKLHGATIAPGKHKRIEGIEKVDKVIHVNQGPIGRTPRSNPATYTGVWDKIRTLLAETKEAKVRGWGPGRFSFNVSGGRCDACSGDGLIKIEMNFLPDVYVVCEECNGSRYNKETLEVHYKGKTVADILEMTIEEANDFFANIPTIHRFTQTLVDVGLGYVKMGQSATTLSGGESQRVKLASELQRRGTGKTVYILDEPTTGLHFDDIKKLLQALQKLTDQGNTLIIIEHNLDVIKSADWVIDLGPEGGSGGGLIIDEGTPEDLVKRWKKTESATGEFLEHVL